MRRDRSNRQSLSLSFLDCICCGFGAVILLLMIVKVVEPQQRERARVDAETRIETLRAQLSDLREELRGSQARLEAARAQASARDRREPDLEAELASLQSRLAALRSEDQQPAQREAELRLALQRLSEEMRRLYGSTPPVRRPDAPIGGIPVDSEYVIFVIDTSGSMKAFAWPSVLQKVEEALSVYPRLKGIQVLSDEGEYMFPRYAARWIPDTPSRRKAILDTLRNWQPFSNSSPVEGIDRAIRTFYSSERRISIYVFGDDYTGDSLAEVVTAVDALNGGGDPSERRVRIHAVGFPVQYFPDEVLRNGYRFAHLMRVLCERNGGAFVGLPGLLGANELFR